MDMDAEGIVIRIGRLEVERMTREDATNSTMEDVEPDESGYGEMEDKLSEFCFAPNEDED